MRSSCSTGVKPSGASACCPLSRWRRSPDTRTWKNSSRLPAKIWRNLTRSSRGFRSSLASCRTRALNSIQESSRLRYRIPIARSARLRGRVARVAEPGRTAVIWRDGLRSSPASRGHSARAGGRGVGRASLTRRSRPPLTAHGRDRGPATAGREDSGPLDRQVDMGSIDTLEPSGMATAATLDIRGDTRAAAFRRIADGHLDDAYRLARVILRDPTEAQDAVHDAFVLAWRHWETLRDEARFEAWFDRILVNTCRDRLRRTSRVETRDISEELAGVTGDPYEASVDRAAIGSALARLSPDHRIVVALRFYRDLPVDEIASRLSIPPGTAHSRLHYALKRLRDVLAETPEGADR